MTTAEMKRPSLPLDLYQPSLTYASVFALYSLLTFYGSGLAAAHVARLDAPLWARALGVGLLLLASQQGVHLMVWVAHEGVHLALHRNRYVSMVVGTFVGSMMLFPTLGYGISHWNHHRFTNQASDPDVMIYPRLRTFWSRFFLARAAAQRGYFRALARLALGRPLPFTYKFPFPPDVTRRLAVANVAFLVFWLGVYGLFAWYAPLTALFTVGLPILLAVPFSGLRIYVEHAGTDIGVFRDSRSYTAWFWTLVFFGNNYHLEHHLYPTVPCYRLPAVHRYLRRRGYYARWGSPIERGIVGPVLFTTAVAQYPGPLGADLEQDPFQKAVQASQAA